MFYIFFQESQRIEVVDHHTLRWSKMEMSAVSRRVEWDRETQVAVSEAKVQLQALQLGKDGAHAQLENIWKGSWEEEWQWHRWVDNIVNAPVGCLIDLRPSLHHLWL